MVAPRPEALQAFRSLLRSSLISAHRLQTFFEDDRAYRAAANDAPSLRADIWYDRDGRPRMEARFGVRQLLALRGDIRRMVAAAGTLMQHLSPEQSAANELAALLAQASGSVQRSSAVISGPEASPVRISALVGMEDVERTFSEFLRTLGQDSRHRNGSRRDPVGGNGNQQEPEHDGSPANALAEAGLAAIQQSDEAQLVLSELVSSGVKTPPHHAARNVQRDLRALWEQLSLPLGELSELGEDIDSLLATRLLAPSVQVKGAGDQLQAAWSAYPWFSVRARSAWRRLPVDKQQREALERFLRQHELASDTQQALGALLAQVADLWSRGADELQRQLDHGLGWELAGGQINLIPSPYRGQCLPVLVIVSIGDQLDARLREAHDHTIRCTGETRTMLLVTDRWDDGKFEADRRSTFEALKDTHQARLAVLIRVGGSFTFQAIT